MTAPRRGEAEGRARRGGWRPGAGRKPHPWRTLTEAAIAYAQAETEQEFRRAASRLRDAARRWHDEPRKRGRPAAGPDGGGGRG